MAWIPNKVHTILYQWTLDIPTLEYDLDLINFRIACRSHWEQYQRYIARNHSLAGRLNLWDAERSNLNSPTSRGLGQNTSQDLHTPSSTVPTPSDKSTSTKATQELSPNPSSSNSKAKPQVCVPSQSIFFTTLPQETRDLVYSFACPAGVNIANSCQRFSDRPLTKVSSAIALEYKGSYYRNTTFLFDTRSSLPDTVRSGLEYIEEACRFGKIWEDWLSTLDEEDAGHIRHLVFYDKDDIVRLELSTTPLKVVVSVKPKDDRVELEDEYLHDIGILEDTWDRRMRHLAAKQSAFTKADLSRMCDEVFDAGGREFGWCWRHLQERVAGCHKCVLMTTFSTPMLW
ncbi:hypothetical protein LTR97_011217 [Elasticomyces elasticus]|uniref:Uncharacterized protein n=1 Tax=Elasticomyces elasticus TaxID=574655 RepID=A0AAN7VN11_9PEZI|nr:hypothetical protein LTR97_011217 [Elasticomyces elasticus]